PEQSVTKFALLDLRGDLRATTNQQLLGTLEWAGHRDIIRSGIHGMEQQIQLACDLDPSRLEQIERGRDGGEASFFIQLWPTMAKSAESFEARVGGFDVQIPRDTWLTVVGSIQKSHFEIVEIQF